MKLISLQIAGFGCLVDFTYNFNDSLNVIERHNAFGKTTLSNFIRAMLYGFPSTKSIDLDKNFRKKYQPWNTSNYGGTLTIELEGNVYRIERKFFEKESADTLKVIELNTNKEVSFATTRLGEYFFGVDIDGYDRCVYIPQIELAKETNNSLQSRLTSAIMNDTNLTGYDNAIKVLEDKKKFYVKTGNRGEIDKLEQSLQTKNREIEALYLKKQQVQIIKNEIDVKESIIKEQELKLENVRKEKDNTLMNGEKEAVYLHFKSIQNDINMYVGELQNMDISNSNNVSDIINDTCVFLNSKVEKYENENYVRNLEQNIHNFDNNVDNLKPKKNNFSLIYGIMAVVFGALGIVLIQSKLIYGIISILFCVAFALLSFAMKINSPKQKKGEQNTLELTKFLNEKYEYDKWQKVKSLYNILCMKNNEIQELKNKCDFGSANYNENQKNVSEIDIQINEIKNNLNELNKAVIIRKENLNMLLNETDKIIEKEAERDSLIEQLETYKYDYDVTIKTIEALNSAKEKLSTSYLPTMQKHFSNHFNQMSVKKFDNVSLDTELNFYYNANSFTKGYNTLSKGYKDMVDFCVRLALIDTIFTKEKPFIILDDSFVNLDNDNLKNVFSLLKELSQKMQIIYMSKS